MNFPDLKQTDILVIPRINHISNTGHHACLTNSVELKVNVSRDFKSIIVNV